MLADTRAIGERIAVNYSSGMTGWAIGVFAVNPSAFFQDQQ